MEVENPNPPVIETIDVEAEHMKFDNRADEIIEPNIDQNDEPNVEQVDPNTCVTRNVIVS